MTSSSQILQVINPLNLDPSEGFTLFTFDTLNAAPAATEAALVNSQISGIARYSGGIFARLGRASEFLNGDMRLLVGFDAGTVSGTVNDLEFIGNDASGRQSVPSLDELVISGVDLQGNRLKATLQGTFDEGGFLIFATPVDQHIVDARMSIVFVDTLPGDRNTDLVGTIDGTITSTADGARTLQGVATGTSGF